MTLGCETDAGAEKSVRCAAQSELRLARRAGHRGGLVRARLRFGLFVSLVAVPALASATPLRRGAVERWEAPVAAAGTVFVRGMRGRIDVVGVDGDRARVVATPRGDADPSVVDLVVLSHGDSITICTVWTRQRGRCEPGRLVHEGDGDRDDRDLQVDLRVEVPRGRTLDARTLNGSLCVGGTTGRVKAETVNGDVTVRVPEGDVEAQTTNGRADAWSATGAVTAEATNGRIEVRIDRVPPGGDVSYETVNGSVVFSIPSAADVRIDAAAVNGAVTGGGGGSSAGRRVRIRTVNGAIRIERR